MRSSQHWRAPYLWVEDLPQAERAMWRSASVSEQSLPPELVSQAEAAARLGVSVDTVKRWRKSGRLTGHRGQDGRGRRWLVELPADLGEVARSLASDGASARVTSTSSASVSIPSG